MISHDSSLVFFMFFYTKMLQEITQKMNDKLIYIRFIKQICNRDLDEDQICTEQTAVCFGVLWA